MSRLLPKQVLPVKRPHFVQPYDCVDVIHGRRADLISIRLELIHGANYNDPQVFQYPPYEYLMMSSVSPDCGDSFY